MSIGGFVSIIDMGFLSFYCHFCVLLCFGSGFPFDWFLAVLAVFFPVCFMLAWEGMGFGFLLSQCPTGFSLDCLNLEI
jgi:hypothetical protein